MVTSEIKHVKTLILGGGITGLATAHALHEQGERSYMVLEKQPVLGGLCATTTQNGYSFDYGGHFLHLHTPQGKRWVKQLLGSNLQKHTRHAFIYTNGMQVPYPFQSNLWALFPEIQEVCVEGLNRIPPSLKPPSNFEEWCVQSFGYGLYEAFFRPYNEKLWGRPLTQLSCDWCGPFVPAPKRAEILKSVTQKPAKSQGYNATFYYPKTGGIGALVNALAKPLKNVRLNSEVTHLNLKAHTAWINQTKPITFEQVVSTLPLPHLISLLDENPSFKKAAKPLEAQSVTVYHLAIARELAPFNWIYFPDASQPFYRVGLTNSFYPTCAPCPNTSLLSIELPGLVEQTPQMEREIWLGLHQKGIIEREDIALFSTWQTIENAYVIFNQYRAQTVPGLLKELEKQHCYCAGRYGRWEYSFMESSLLQAQQLAKKLA